VTFVTTFEHLDQPASRFVAEFIGQTSFLTGSTVDAADGVMMVRLASRPLLKARSPGHWKPGDPVVVGARAERLELRASASVCGNTIAARVQSPGVRGFHVRIPARDGGQTAAR
jgi:spermidine/putrescine transport system ATP-binding protein